MTGVAWHLPVRWLAGNMAWHERALCRGLGMSDDYWFTHLTRSAPQSTPQIRRALELCQECPVRALCWRQAASDPMAEGVWGGEYWPTSRAAWRDMRLRGPLIQSRP